MSDAMYGITFQLFDFKYILKLMISYIKINMKTMRPITSVMLIIISVLSIEAQSGKEINLLIRGDDIGSSHTSNIACIESYKNGIMRSVELMVPGPWFPEAVRLLNENPGLDVGVHLVVTSEWNDIKWRPLTCCPSLVDKDGYFFPMIWQRPDFPAGTALKDAPWKIEEIEQEFRAQIQMARRYVPRVSHMDCHMGCESCSPEIASLVARLSREYKMDIKPSDKGYKYIGLWGKNDTTANQRIKSAVKTLKSLGPGSYLFIDHPGLDTPEMRAIWHKGYENVAADRDGVTKVFTSKEVFDAVKSSGIRLVSYKYVSEN
jgi:chitin disaccharide deacetylase